MRSFDVIVVVDFDEQETNWRPNADDHLQRILTAGDRSETNEFL